ncbi:MAG: hypothetical protein ABIO36_00310 [Pyrinomonadaceae bacterium]
MKNTITAFAMTIVLMMGATFANAGIIISDGSESACTSRDGIIISDIAGIIISDIAEAVMGIIISDGKESGPCKNTNGIIISD